VAYLRAIYAGFLRGGDREAASNVLATLRSYGAADGRVLRLYVRHAPEFRKLKSLLHYDGMRLLANRLARRLRGGWRGKGQQRCG
jgi:hypothetical protein